MMDWRGRRLVHNAYIYNEQGVCITKSGIDIWENVPLPAEAQNGYVLSEGMVSKLPFAYMMLTVQQIQSRMIGTITNGKFSIVDIDRNEYLDRLYGYGW